MPSPNDASSAQKITLGHTDDENASIGRRVTIVHASSSTGAFARSTRLVRAETHRKDLGRRSSPVLAPVVVVA
jgi:hypothetical protein